MMNSGRKIIEYALKARTLAQAEAVQDMIETSIGTRCERPLGDTWNNQGILTGSGASYDHKALEVVTNMQDAVLELAALQQFRTRRAVPFASPREAADSLYSEASRSQLAALSQVTVDSAGVDSNKKMVTLVVRDLGCGIGAADVPRSIFRVGAGSKDGVDWLQGTFGLGGATTYRNAQAVVLVTRRRPELLEPRESDRITVAVVQWERHRTTTNAFYLVVAGWDERNPSTWEGAQPISISAADYPEFDPGTHLALIGFESEGFARRSGDEKSFDTVLNTRLFRPVLPVQYRNNITRPDRHEILDGLARRLKDNPGKVGLEGEDVLPFNCHNHIYRLPIQFRLFAKPGEKGQRRNFVANGHALIVTSNGQVHSHWSPQEFKARTRLKRLYDRILVEVRSDELPVEVRTELFTADRAQFVQRSVAMRLEKEITAFLDDWPELHEANNVLIREAITGDNNDRPTIAIAKQIARAVKAKGFSVSSLGTKTRPDPPPPPPTPVEELLEDPTHFEGPDAIEAVAGDVKPVHFKLNAKDGFVARRCAPRVTCDHPDLDNSVISIGELRSGRFRLTLAVPSNADLGIYNLSVVLDDWSRASGGLGPRLAWCTKVEVVEERRPRRRADQKSGLSGGSLVGLIWKSDTEDGVDWTSASVGEVEMVAGRELAQRRDEYVELADVDAEIPTIVLNRTYAPLKSYIQARATELTEEGKEQCRERYAVGAGVALLVLDEMERDNASKGEEPLDEETLLAGQRAAARAVLSVLPEYDRLAREFED